MLYKTVVQFIFFYSHQIIKNKGIGRFTKNTLLIIVYSIH